MKKSNHINQLVSAAMLMLAVISLNACAGGYDKPLQPRAESLSINFSYNPKTGITLRDKDGEKLKKCSLPCPEELQKKYGFKCPEVKEENVCVGLIDATVVNVETLTIIQSVHNPYCYDVIDSRGNRYEKCYCYPGEIHPKCP